MWVCGSAEVSFGGSSLSPMMGVSIGADGHELCSTSLHPTLYSICVSEIAAPGESGGVY